ncbi:hypothetical protein Afil01_58640 [Actinorhabdospora filicis]|uniref:Ankyrin repeat protein n=1 Tax=Actinorhabdospora filicis TaxID=1785913 RepID=A0A9W6SRS4_9ACTN|nr:ankyrin repeat domain-containing protein [Actinorhabdospora filicis]GLZ81057.1 hypothetical protein Afil01_58640 [Actinorhabdospora filicis]
MGTTRRAFLALVPSVAVLAACSAQQPPAASSTPKEPSAMSQSPEPRPAASRRLLAASADGDTAAVTAAIAAGADLETRDGDRRTPLLLAATFDHVDVAKALVAAGADPDALDGRHDTPWLVTGVTGSVAMMNALLPAKPDLTIRNRYGGISLIPACERGHVDYVREVLKTGIAVDHVNDLGWTGLLEAIVYGDGSGAYQQIVSLLIAGGADPRKADGNGVTPLSHAERMGQAKIAAILRAAGA